MRSAIVAWLVLLTGCATHLSAIGGPTVDGSGVGGAGGVDFTAALGAPDIRAYAGVGVGGGHLRVIDHSFVSISPMAGMEGGRDWIWGVGGTFGPRFIGGTAAGGGISAQLLRRVGDAGGEHGSYSAGLRVSLEALFGDRIEAAVGRSGVAVLHVGVVLRWTTFDTTAARWF